MIHRNSKDKEVNVSSKKIGMESNGHKELPGTIVLIITIYILCIYIYV